MSLKRDIKSFYFLYNDIVLLHLQKLLVCFIYAYQQNIYTIFI